MQLLKICSEAHSLGNKLQTRSHQGERLYSFNDLFCRIPKDLGVKLGIL